MAVVLVPATPKIPFVYRGGDRCDGDSEKEERDEEEVVVEVEKVGVGVGRVTEQHPKVLAEAKRKAGCIVPYESMK